MTSTTNLETIDLMDELKCKDVIARRLALAFTICCVANNAAATDIDAKSTKPAASMRGFLAQGWQSEARSVLSESTRQQEQLDSRISTVSSVVEETSPARRGEDLAPSILFKPADAGSSVIATESRATESREPAASLADLIREDSESYCIPTPTPDPLIEESAATPLGLPVESVAMPLGLPVVPESIDREEPAVVEAADSIENLAAGNSLADFLRAHHDQVVTPMEESHWSNSELDPELTRQDQFDAPERRPLPTGDWLPSNTVEAQLVVQTAPQITTERTTEAGPVPTTEDATQHVASLRTNVSREDSSIQASPKVPTFVSVPPRILHASNQRPQLSPLPAEKSEVDQSPEPSDMASVVPDESTTAAQGDTASLPILPNPVRDPQQSTTESDLLLAGEQLQLEADDEDAMMRIPSLENGEALARPVPVPLRTPSVTLHTTRLLELSQQLVLRSQQSLQRGATHTARKSAIEAMQAVVAMRDAQEGGNVHSQQLESAFDAIRESKDFCGEFGSVDSQALGRMVDVHETTTLKQQDLSTITALEATEAYLDYAKEQLVLASGGIREGSQALLLLGQVELTLANATDTHSTSVAVAVQRAAVESDPYFAIGYQVLGTTLLNLGLIEESAECLIASLRIQPTRVAYERLLDIARRLGDVDTARACMKALEDPRMAEGSLVRQLTPQQFAATHRPVSTTIHQARSSSESDTTRAQSEPSARIGFGSLFPFGRR